MLVQLLDIGMESGPKYRAHGSTSQPLHGGWLSFDARLWIRSATISGGLARIEFAAHAVAVNDGPSGTGGALPVDFLHLVAPRRDRRYLRGDMWHSDRVTDPYLAALTDAVRAAAEDRARHRQLDAQFDTAGALAETRRAELAEMQRKLAWSKPTSAGSRSFPDMEHPPLPCVTGGCLTMSNRR